MNRRLSLLVGCVLAFGYLLAGPSAALQAQSFAGKWIHRGPKGMSTLEFFNGERRPIGPTRGAFRHSIVMDDGRLIQGDGHYVFRSIGPNRGRLVLHFGDGHVTTEHEHTIDHTVLNLRHHGLSRSYVRP